MSPLPSDDRRALLRLAREAIVASVCENRMLETPPCAGALAERCGAFVSLHAGGCLRGCIGRLDATDSLAGTVIFCAVCAAQDDPRFAPVTADESGALEIEISVLSPLSSIHPEEIQPGVHGLRVSRGPFHGVLLPQVAAEFHWGRERFLEETCVKAGLPRDAWRDPATRVESFTAEVFSEAELLPERQARAS